MENSKTTIHSPAVRHLQKGEQKNKIRLSQVHLLPRKSWELSKCHFSSKPKSSWEILPSDAYTALEILFSKLFSLHCQAKQILPWFYSSGWVGRRALGWAVLHSPVTQTLPTEGARVGPAGCSQVQAPFPRVTADHHLEQLNSKQSAHFLSKIFFRSIWKVSSLFLSTWDTVLCWSWRVLNWLCQEVQHRAVTVELWSTLKNFRVTKA